MPHGNKTGMNYTIQLSTKNYELRELHEDRGYRMNNTLNALRQKDITTQSDRKLIHKQKNIMTKVIYMVHVYNMH